MATVSDHKTFDCPLCFKKFTTPRVLPCSHTFCEECLCAYVESHVQGGSEFRCPLCSAITVPCDSSLAVDKWASTFPLNAIIISVLEITECLNTSDTTCGPCKTDGETSAVKFWCNECREKICHSCYKSHKRIKILKPHKIVPINEMEQLIQPNVEFNQECDSHRDKVKDLFCLDHRKLCCAACVASDHRQCNDVRRIDDIARDQSQRSTFDYPSIIRDFRKLKTEMEKIMGKKKINATQILQEKNQIFHDMDNRIDTIIMHLNKFRNTFRSETDQLYKDTESSLLKNEEIVHSFITNIDNSSEILKVVEKSGTLQHKFTTFEHLRSQIMSHYKQVNLRLKDDVEVHFTLKANKLLSDLEETLKLIGSVEVFKMSSTISRDVLQSVDKIMKNLNSRTKISTEMCAAQVEKVEDFMTSPVEFVKSVTIDTLGNGTWFTGGTYLGDGRLVMCDINNRQLVELDDEYNVVKKYKIDGQPTDIATGNRDNEIYITVVKVASGCFIYKCVLHTDLTIVSRIKAPSNTWGVAVCGDNIIVGTNDAVVILTQDGSRVRSIPKAGTYGYVAVSKTGRSLYHRDKNDIICRAWEGQEVFRYQHHQMKWPRGICTDKYNNVYICGSNCHNVHQVSSDGQKSRIIKLRKISDPLSVVLHPRQNQLIVTSWNEHTVCEIYKLS